MNSLNSIYEATQQTFYLVRHVLNHPVQALIGIVALSAFSSASDAQLLKSSVPDQICFGTVVALTAAGLSENDRIFSVCKNILFKHCKDSIEKPFHTAYKETLMRFFNKFGNDMTPFMEIDGFTLGTCLASDVKLIELRNNWSKAFSKEDIDIHEEALISILHDMEEIVFKKE